jgi:UDP-glucose 4-epimerase
MMAGHRTRTQVVLVENLSTGTKAHLPGKKGNWTFIKADVNSFEDMAAIMIAQRFD